MDTGSILLHVYNVTDNLKLKVPTYEYPVCNYATMYYITSYLHFIPLRCSTWSLKRSSAAWRLVTLSPAAKQQNTHVLWTELGVAILTIWKFILNVSPPLSPPIFIHTSLAGMNPSCQVSLLVLHEKVHAKMLAYAMVRLSKLITSHSLLRGGQLLQPALHGIYMYMRGAQLISSPPNGSIKGKGASSPFRLSPIDLS